MAHSPTPSTRPRLRPLVVTAVVIAAALVAAASALPQAVGRAEAAVPTTILYDDALADGVQNWSWASVDLASTDPVRSGGRAIAVDLAPWGGLSLGIPATLDVSPGATLVFDVHPGSNGDVALRVVTMNADFSAGPTVHLVHRPASATRCTVGPAGGRPFASPSTISVGHARSAACGGRRALVVT